MKTFMNYIIYGYERTILHRLVETDLKSVNLHELLSQLRLFEEGYCLQYKKYLPWKFMEIFDIR